MIITSNTNEQIKNLIHLKDKSKARKTSGTFIVEGIKMFQEIPKEDFIKAYASENFYEKRKEEQKRIVSEFGIKFLDCDYENEKFKSMSKGLEDLPEGGYRCHKCYELRLTKTALTAKENNFLYFGTTLTVSPYKNSQVLNAIGKDIEELTKVKFLYSDFKKKEGYKLSIELSKKYNLYRQNYCGCRYSKMPSSN